MPQSYACPWWFIGSFDNPLRGLIHRPNEILAGLVHTGQTVLDLGPGMGYFSIPLALMVGEGGKVIAADLQPQMLAGLCRRAERAGVLSRIETVQSQRDCIGISSPLDFALTFWMLHEVRLPQVLLTEIFHHLKPGATLLLVEPVIHVTKHQFYQEVQAAIDLGYHPRPGPAVRLSRSILLQRP